GRRGLAPLVPEERAGAGGDCSSVAAGRGSRVRSNALSASGGAPVRSARVAARLERSLPPGRRVAGTDDRKRVYRFASVLKRGPTPGSLQPPRESTASL